MAKTNRPAVSANTAVTNRAMRRNIVRMLRRDKRLAEIERAWYRRAYKWARLLSESANVSIELVASIAAVISPNVEWIDNRRMTIALLRNPNATHFRNRLGTWSLMVGYPANIDKARRMIATGDITILSGPKVTRFRDAILGIDACVIDVHATNIAMGTENVYSGPSANAYGLFEAAYTDVARMLGWRVCEVQSATWSVYKATKKTRGQ